MRKDLKSPYPNLIKKMLEQANDAELRLIYVFVRELLKGGDQNDGTDTKRAQKVSTRR